MNNLIYKQDAIDTILSQPPEPHYPSWYAEQIKNLPPAQPEQRWIPVTERLPEDEYVINSKKPTKISGDKWSIAIAIRTADQRSGKIQWRDSGFGVIQDDKVLAWMPLPAPWEGEKK